MKFLILAPASDEAALHAAVLLRRRHGAGAIEVRSPEELLLATWEHRISADGVDARIQLHDGTLLPQPGQAVVLNRILAVEPPQFIGASSANQDYARMESAALLVSWLFSFGPHVVNTPSPAALSGGVYRPLVWQSLAARAGLETLELSAASSTRRFPPPSERVLRSDIELVHDPLAHLPTNTFQWCSLPVPERRRSVFVIGARVIGEVSRRTSEACVRLAELARVSLLKIELGGDGLFLGADPCPTLPRPEAILALVEFLESRGEAA